MISIRYKAYEGIFTTLRKTLAKLIFVVLIPIIGGEQLGYWRPISVGIIVGTIIFYAEYRKGKRLERLGYMLKVQEDAIVLYPGQKRERQISLSDGTWVLRKYSLSSYLIHEGEEYEINLKEIHPEDVEWLETNLHQVKGILPHWLAPKNKPATDYPT
ncbi:MAG TPA: hypothetical protein DCE41_01045 [Cytophagales bacterium]|nr:hypothetical protein [Cytophagales bacterium]HAA21125.1 hypothetical protein [Cytophagales bacterium]HAP63375.1 hypothetical protein [Cytophagales bacterium]